MLTRLTIRNFKKFESATIELGNPVVFIGPNNSGKTTALQALALWDIGLKRWSEKRGNSSAPEKRSGVTINRRDLISVPVPESILLWRDRHVRQHLRENGSRLQTQGVLIEIIVDGVTGGVAWSCGLEFDYANPESFYCRPLRLNPEGAARMPVPPQAAGTAIAYLPPMSGLAAAETRLDRGAINVRLGEGRTAEVLRNLCWHIIEASDDRSWLKLASRIESLFGVRLHQPEYIAERGELSMQYSEGSGVTLDLASAGRGLQQTLLLLAHLAVNPGSVLLLDEPDAHLEILRQHEIYRVLTEAAAETGSQVIAASHSEIILEEAADRDVVVAFLGNQPRRIDDRGSQLLKSLRDIPFRDYYQAEQTGWVLYLEGSTDLAILAAFANTLGHPAAVLLQRPFVRYVGNDAQQARHHFFGLRQARPDLAGVAIFDRLDRALQEDSPLRETMWRKRELENYLCRESVLLDWVRFFASEGSQQALFADQWVQTMEERIRELEHALKTLDKPSPWSDDIKATDDFLDPLFAQFFRAIGLENLMRKSDYHRLAGFVRADEVDAEIVRALDLIVKTAGTARTAMSQ